MVIFKEDYLGTSTGKEEISPVGRDDIQKRRRLARVTNRFPAPGADLFTGMARDFGLWKTQPHFALPRCHFDQREKSPL
jgi:hypothetical protein